MVIGDPTESGDVGEPSLDIELMMGLLGPKQNLSLYQVGETSASQDPSTSYLKYSASILLTTDVWDLQLMKSSQRWTVRTAPLLLSVRKVN